MWTCGQLSAAVASTLNADTNCISLNFKGISRLDPLDPRFHHIRRLFLSQNRIAKLSGLTPFVKLRELSLSHNFISSFAELDHVSAAHRLEKLSLEGNPIFEHPNYICRVLRRFPSLKELDGQQVAQADRIAVAQAEALERDAIPYMLAQEELIDELYEDIIIEKKLFFNYSINF